jgi:hypothetical protein
MRPVRRPCGPVRGWTRRSSRRRIGRSSGMPRHGSCAPWACAPACCGAIARNPILISILISILILILSSDPQPSLLPRAAYYCPPTSCFAEEHSRGVFVVSLVVNVVGNGTDKAYDKARDKVWLRPKGRAGRYAGKLEIRITNSVFPGPSSALRVPSSALRMPSSHLLSAPRLDMISPRRGRG